LRVHLVGSLSGDELRNFLDRIDVGVLEVTLPDAGKADITRHADHRRTRGLSLAIEIAADWLQSRFIGEVGESELAEELQLRLVLDAGENLPAFVDDDVRRLFRYVDSRLHDIAV